MVFDDSGTVISDRRMVGDTVTVIALAERAEEVSAATAAEDLQLAFSDLAATLGPIDHEAASAAAAVAGAAATTAAAAAGPRAASPSYLDQIAEIAADLGAEPGRLRAACRTTGGRGRHRSGQGGAGRGGMAGAGAGGPLGRSCRIRPGHDCGHRCDGRAGGRGGRALPCRSDLRTTIRLVRIVDRAIVSTLPAVPRPVVRRVAGRYVAGETLDRAIEQVRRLNAAGEMATIDVLGEFCLRRCRGRGHSLGVPRGTRRRSPPAASTRTSRSSSRRSVWSSTATWRSRTSAGWCVPPPITAARCGSTWSTRG